MDSNYYYIQSKNSNNIIENELFTDKSLAEKFIKEELSVDQWYVRRCHLEIRPDQIDK